MKKTILLFPLSLMALTACTALQPSAANQTATPAPLETVPQAGLPNPASLYCTQQGNRFEIRTAGDGSQNGVCIFPEGSSCDEWAY